MSNLPVLDATKEEQWLLKKWGCFSASEMYKLLSKGTGEMFGTGAKTYIEEVAIQAYTLFNTEENVETYAMKKGKMKEADSFGYYRNLFAGSNVFDHIEYYGGDNPIFEKYNEHSGCSPDSLAFGKKNKVMFGAEFKNNQRKAHFTDLRRISDHFDLKRDHLDDYTQCQFSMMCYNVDLWHWNSYNEYFPDSDKLLIIEVPKDKIFQDNLEIRLQMAIKIRNRIIEQRRNNYKGEIDFK